MTLLTLASLDPVAPMRWALGQLPGGFTDLPILGFNGWGARAFPLLNVWEEERSLVVEAEIPGLKLEDIEVLVSGDELTISGERKAETAEGTTVHRRERGVGRFSRVVRLPVEVNADAVEATLREGVLTVRLPKAESVLPRRIAVKS